MWRGNKMANLVELGGGARLPVFERLSKGLEAIQKRGESAYDLTDAEVKRELWEAAQQLQTARGPMVQELLKIIEALNKILRERRGGRNPYDGTCPGGSKKNKMGTCTWG